GEGGGEGAQGALGEVDDAVRAVDEDETHGEQAVEGAEDEALQEDPVRRVGAHPDEEVAVDPPPEEEHGEQPGQERGRRTDLRTTIDDGSPQRHTKPPSSVPTDSIRRVEVVSCSIAGLAGASWGAFMRSRTIRW